MNNTDYDEVRKKIDYLLEASKLYARRRRVSRKLNRGAIGTAILTTNRQRLGVISNLYEQDPEANSSIIAQLGRSVIEDYVSMLYIFKAIVRNRTGLHEDPLKRFLDFSIVALVADSRRWTQDESTSTDYSSLNRLFEEVVERYSSSDKKFYDGDNIPLPHSWVRKDFDAILDAIENQKIRLVLPKSILKSLYVVGSRATHLNPMTVEDFIGWSAQELAPWRKDTAATFVTTSALCLSAMFVLILERPPNNRLGNLLPLWNLQDELKRALLRIHSV